MRPKAVAIGVTVAAILAVFVTIAVSVVDARRPLDRNVSRSFDSVILQRADASSIDATAEGCHELRLYFYDCVARLQLGPRRPALSVRWRMQLRDGGCWDAQHLPGDLQAILPGDLQAIPTRTLVAVRALVRRLQGCSR